MILASQTENDAHKELVEWTAKPGQSATFRTNGVIVYRMFWKIMKMITIIKKHMIYILHTKKCALRQEWDMDNTWRMEEKTIALMT